MGTIYLRPTSILQALIFPRTGEYPHRSVSRIAALLIALLPLAALTAAPRARAQDAAASSGYAVRGTVTNAVSNQPVARALVALDQDEAMLTDSNGQFSFDNVAAGSYSISVNKPGYRGHGGMMFGVIRVAGRGVPLQPEPPVRVQVGPDMPALTLSITPLATITGHVTLSTADPADGIRVQVYARRLQNGHPHWTVAGEARTRSDGSFRIADLEPGTYMVSTMASLDRPGQAFSNDSHVAIWGYPSLYYPGTTDINAAGVLNVGAGQQAEADLTLVRQQFFPVVALVHSGSDVPANFEILESGGRQTGLAASWNRREDVVRAAVPNGTWTMEAHAYGRTMEWGSTTFQVNGAPTTLAINVQPVPRIPVIVHREFLASADGSQPQNAGLGVNLNLVSADAMSDNFGGGGLMRNENPDGSVDWELNVNEPGRYWIQAQAWPPGYVSAVTSGGVDLGSNPLLIIPGSNPAPIEVTLRNDGGTINGEIADQTSGSSAGGTPAPGELAQVWIYAIPLFATASGLPQGYAQQNRQFTIPNLAPGTYRVVACDAPQEIDFHSPDGLAPWAGKGETVTVDAGGTASVDLDVIHVIGETQ